MPPEKQGELHDAIYNKSWGIKAVSPVTLKAVNEFRGFAATLKAAEAEIAILGCTEIPLAMPEPDFDGEYGASRSGGGGGARNDSYG